MWLLLLLVLLILAFIVWKTDLFIYWNDARHFPPTVFRPLDKEKAKKLRAKPSNEKVLVVGGGAAGLNMAGSLARHLIPFDIVEQQPCIGGMWRYQIYDNVKLISQKCSTEYKDFPMPKEYPDILSKSHILQYLDDYAAHYELTDYIQFNTAVVKLVQNKDDSWTVTVRNLITKEETTKVYMAVVMATGHLTKDAPTFENQSSFQGELVHSLDYHPDILKDKRVLVVGMGKSGLDIATHAASSSKEVHIATRFGVPLIVPITFLGIHVRDFEKAWIPPYLYMLLLKVISFISFGGDYGRFGLKRKQHHLYGVEMHSFFMHHARIGALKYHQSTIKRFEPNSKTVLLENGEKIEVDLVVLCTGLKYQNKVLEEHITTKDTVPQFVNYVMVEGKKNIYITGLGRRPHGFGVINGLMGEEIAQLIGKQKEVQLPVYQLMKPFSTNSFFEAKSRNFMQPRPYQFVKAFRLQTMLVIPLLDKIEKVGNLFGMWKKAKAQ